MLKLPKWDKSVGAWCPISRRRCRMDCAWRTGDNCAVNQMAQEQYAAVELMCQRFGAIDGEDEAMTHAD